MQLDPHTQPLLSPTGRKLINKAQKIVNGRYVNGSLVHSESNMSVIVSELTEIGCFVGFCPSLVFKFDDLVKYARLTYGLSSAEYKCMNTIAMGRKEYISFSAFLFASCLQRIRAINTLDRLVNLGYAEISFHVYKGRKCKRVSLTAAGRSAYEDCGRYWDDVLRYRTM